MNASGENYLEAIYRLGKENKAVRSINVARALKVSKPSVSRAMGLLKEAGYIEISQNGEISFTKAGLEKAEDLVEKHESIMRFLMMTADVSPEIAEKDAYEMKHFIQEETFKGILEFMKQVDEYEE